MPWSSFAAAGEVELEAAGADAAAVALASGSPDPRTGASPADRSAWLSGVQDYLREPWTEEELFLRARGPRLTSVNWTWAGKRLHLEGRTLVAEDGVKVRLPATEALILGLLVQRRGQPVARNILAWEAKCSPDRVIDTLICRLRKKVQAAAGSPDDPILTVRNLGYQVP